MNISRLVKTVFSGGWKGHFGQYAEDVIVRKYFPHNTKVGRYLDIGAHHPFKHSNTAFFWLRGWSGINVDANPLSVELFRRVRKQDVNIHAAVVTEAEMAKGRKNVSLFLPGAVDQEIAISGVGTTKKSHISNDQSYQELLVPACSVKQILVENKVRNLDLLNIDIEGSDYDVLTDFDFNLVVPRMIIIEDFTSSFEGLVSSDINIFLASKEYKLVGRVGWSSIYSYRGQSF